MQTQEEFYLANAVDGVLSDAQTMQMMSLPEGDTVTSTEISDPPAADTLNDDDNDDVTAKTVVPAVAPAANPAPEAPKPVVLAKDGVHTIPFETLEAAREGEKHWKTVAEQALQQLEATKAAPAAAAPATDAPATPAEAFKADFGDFSEEALTKGVEKLVDARVAAIVDAKVNTVLAPVQERQAKTEAEEHLDAIHAKHPDMESVVPSNEFAAWFHAQPKFAQPGIQAVLQQGTADEVNELLDTYKAATGKTAVPTTPAVVPAVPVVNAKAQAAAAIAKAQSAVPTSLSEIPAAGNVHHDQGEAMLEMSEAGLMNMFDGKSPEQITAMLNRAI